MGRPAVLAGVIIIVNACIWGLAIVMSSHTLSGTDGYEQIQNILSGGAAASLIVVGGGIAGLLAKMKAKN